MPKNTGPHVHNKDDPKGKHHHEDEADEFSIKFKGDVTELPAISVVAQGQEKKPKKKRKKSNGKAKKEKLKKSLEQVEQNVKEFNKLKDVSQRAASGGGGQGPGGGGSGGSGGSASVNVPIYIPPFQPPGASVSQTELREMNAAVLNSINELRQYVEQNFGIPFEDIEAQAAEELEQEDLLLPDVGNDADDEEDLLGGVAPEPVAQQLPEPVNMMPPIVQGQVYDGPEVVQGVPAPDFDRIPDAEEEQELLRRPPLIQGRGEDELVPEVLFVDPPILAVSGLELRQRQMEEFQPSEHSAEQLTRPELYLRPAGEQFEAFSAPEPVVPDVSMERLIREREARQEVEGQLADVLSRPAPLLSAGETFEEFQAQQPVESEVTLERLIKQNAAEELKRELESAERQPVVPTLQGSSSEEFSAPVDTGEQYVSDAQRQIDAAIIGLENAISFTPDTDRTAERERDKTNADAVKQAQENIRQAIEIIEPEQQPFLTEVVQNAEEVIEEIVESAGVPEQLVRPGLDPQDIPAERPAYIPNADMPLPKTNKGVLNKIKKIDDKITKQEEDAAKLEEEIQEFNDLLQMADEAYTEGREAGKSKVKLIQEMSDIKLLESKINRNTREMKKKLLKLQELNSYRGALGTQLTALELPEEVVIGNITAAAPSQASRIAYLINNLNRLRVSRDGQLDRVSRLEQEPQTIIVKERLLNSLRTLDALDERIQRGEDELNRTGWNI